MEKKVKKSRIARVPAWALSALILVATLLFVIILDSQGMKRELSGQDRVYIGPLKLREIIDFIIFLIIIPIAIFFICRKYPKSVWYTPVIGNAVGFGMVCTVIIDSIFDPGNQITLSDWIMWGCSCGLSVAGAIIGARIGRHRISQVK